MNVNCLWRESHLNNVTSFSWWIEVRMDTICILLDMTFDLYSMIVAWAVLLYMSVTYKKCVLFMRKWKSVTVDAQTNSWEHHSWLMSFHLVKKFFIAAIEYLLQCSYKWITRHGENFHLIYMDVHYSFNGSFILQRRRHYVIAWKEAVIWTRSWMVI